MIVWTVWFLIQSILVVFIVSPATTESGSGFAGTSGDEAEDRENIPSNLSIEVSGDDGSGSYVYYLYRPNNFSNQHITAVRQPVKDDHEKTTHVHPVQDTTEQRSTPSLYHHPDVDIQPTDSTTESLLFPWLDFNSDQTTTTTSSVDNYSTDTPRTEEAETKLRTSTDTRKTNTQQTTYNNSKETRLEDSQNTPTIANSLQDITSKATEEQTSFQATTTFTASTKENESLSNLKTRRKSNLLLYRDVHVTVIVFLMTSKHFETYQDFMRNLEDYLSRVLQASYGEDEVEDAENLRHRRRSGDGKEFSNRVKQIEVKVIDAQVIKDKLVEVKFVVKIDEELIPANQVTNILSTYSLEKLSELLQIDVVSFDVEKKAKELDTTESYLLELIIITSVFVCLFGLLVSFILWILMFNRRKKIIFPIPANVALSECSAMQRAGSQDSMRVFSCSDEVTIDNHLAVKIENWLNGETEKPFKRRYHISTNDRGVQTIVEKARPEVKENAYLSPIKQASFPKETQTDPYEWQWQEIKSQIESSFHTYEIPPQTPEKYEDQEQMLEHTYQSISGMNMSDILASTAREPSVQEESVVKPEIAGQFFEDGPPIEKEEKTQDVNQGATQIEKAENSDTLTVEREKRREKQRQKRRNRTKRKSKKSETSMEECSEVRMFPKVKGATDDRDRRINRTLSRNSKIYRDRHSSKKEKKHKKLAQARAELDAILGGCEPEIFSPLYLNYKERNRLRWNQADTAPSALKESIYW